MASVKVDVNEHPAETPPLTRRQRERQREFWTGRRAADLDEAQLAQAKVAGYQPGPDNGFMVGRDPRTMTPVELKLMGHFPKPILDAVRAKCVDCCGGELAEVRRCVSMTCDLWAYRMGTNPHLRPTAAQRRQRAAALEQAAAQKIARAAGPKSAEDDAPVDQDLPALSRENLAPESGEPGRPEFGVRR